MIEEKKLLKLAQNIAQKNSFNLGKIIYKGLYYSQSAIRSAVFDGLYEGKPAVLKIYDDPRLTFDGPNLENLNRENRSSVILTPRLYAYDAISASQGWIIMEKLPNDGNFLKSPLDKKGRKDFLNLFLDYKKNFSQRPYRPLSLGEKLSAGEFHCFRISRWFELAAKADANLILRKEEPLLDSKEFIPLYEKAMEIIRDEFKDRKMAWCAHGHVVPNQIYSLPEGKYYLTDFSHAKMYPEGYELAFIVWSDWIMHADWRMEYNEWQEEINNYWLDCENIVASKIGWKLKKADLIERILGTILADVMASDMAREEKQGRLNYLIDFLKHLI